MLWRKRFMRPIASGLRRGGYVFTGMKGHGLEYMRIDSFAVRQDGALVMIDEDELVIELPDPALFRVEWNDEEAA